MITVKMQIKHSICIFYLKKKDIAGSIARRLIKEVMNEKELRAQFPLIENSKIIYMDNAATTQKPQCVIDAITEFYTRYNANPMRGIYELSNLATDAYEEARNKVASFINAKSSDEIIFTRNATESLNLASRILDGKINEDDEILIATSEHHSNFLPWKSLAERRKAKVRYLDVNEEGEITFDSLKGALSERTKVFAAAWISNVLGRVNPIKELARIAHDNGTLLVVDAAQSIAHIPTDVQETDVDFLAFSGHKMYGPMGIGVLYGRAELLEKLPPFLEGGEMIDYVSKERTVYSEAPHKFEAGTVSAADAYALGAAIDFINKTGLNRIEKREDELTQYAFERIKGTAHVRIIGSKEADRHKGIISFNLDGVHSHDVARILAESNICVRAGHQCAKPLHILLGEESSVRVSLGFYNTKEEIDIFAKELFKVRERMGC